MTATAELPIEGLLPDLDGATAWLNSAPLTPEGLRGRVVVVQFCTFSCHHHFGEEDYERSEQVIQQLLTEVGGADIVKDLVSVQPEGVSLGADWAALESPETYVGYDRATGFASPGGLKADRPRIYEEPRRLSLNRWALSGDWTVRPQLATLNQPGGRIVHRFRARDANLVLGAAAAPVRFLLRIDGAPPGGSSGLDVDEQGNGTVSDERLYQLIRQDGRVVDRTVEITFLDVGVQAYVFTFG